MTTATEVPRTTPEQRRPRERAAGTPPAGPPPDPATHGAARADGAARVDGTDRAAGTARLQRDGERPPVLRLAGYDDYDGYDGTERDTTADGDWHICRGID